MMHDIYGDLDNFDMGEIINELKDKNIELTEKVNELVKQLEVTVKDLEQVRKENVILTQNISKLYNTAKADFERKTKMINELRKKLDDLLFRRNQGQKNFDTFKIPKRKANQNDENNDRPENKKAKLDVPVQIKKKPKSPKNEPIERNQDEKKVVQKVIENKNERYRDNRRERFDKKNRRSRSRSRERKPDNRHRSERDNDRKRSSPDRADRRKSKNDILDLENSFQNEQKRVMEMIQRNKSRQTDVDCISIDSKSSNESPKRATVKDKIDKKSKEENRIEINRPKETSGDRHKDNIKKPVEKLTDKNDIQETATSAKENGNKIDVAKSNDDSLEEGEISEDENELSRVQKDQSPTSKRKDPNRTNSKSDKNYAASDKSTQDRTASKRNKENSIDKRDQLQSDRKEKETKQIQFLNESTSFESIKQERTAIKIYKDSTIDKSDQLQSDPKEKETKQTQFPKESTSLKSIKQERTANKRYKESSIDKRDQLQSDQKKKETKQIPFSKDSTSFESIKQERSEENWSSKRGVGNQRSNDIKEQKNIKNGPETIEGNVKSNAEPNGSNETVDNSFDFMSEFLKFKQDPSCSITNDKIETEKTVKSDVSKIIGNPCVLSVNSENMTASSLDSLVKKDIKAEKDEKENVASQNVTQMVTPMVKPKPKRPRCRLLP